MNLTDSAIRRIAQGIDSGLKPISAYDFFGGSIDVFFEVYDRLAGDYPEDRVYNIKDDRVKRIINQINGEAEDEGYKLMDLEEYLEDAIFQKDEEMASEADLKSRLRERL